jgi:hypothetical protein
VRYLPLFPFSCSPLLSLYGYILSRLSMIAGSQVGRLTDPHLHLYPHITSPTDRRSFPYLANFMAAVSGVGAIELSCRLFRHIHVAPKTFVIYNSNPELLKLASFTLPGFTKVSKHLSLPSIPTTFAPFQCTLIMLLLVTTQHTGTKQLALTSKNLEDISH